MIERDLKLLRYLEKFRVLSRDQIGKLVCSDTANPSATATRICKRLARDGYLTIIPQPREHPYLYMPKPPMIHPNSTHTKHFLAIADIFIQQNEPKHFDVEPQISKDYQPDILTTIDGIPVIVEVQLTRISSKRIQSKADEFVRSYRHGDHEAKLLWIYSECPYMVSIPSTFNFQCGLDLGANMFQLI